MSCKSIASFVQRDCSIYPRKNGGILCVQLFEQYIDICIYIYIYLYVYIYM